MKHETNADGPRSIPIPSLFTPATLYVISTPLPKDTMLSVPILAINDPHYANFFEYSSSPFGLNGTSFEQSVQMFLGPRTIIERLSVATASGGSILPIQPPFVNSSYQIQFYGPTVQCEEANATVQAAIAQLTSEQLVTNPTTKITEVMNAYIAFVPGVSDPGTGGITLDRIQQPSNGSNQLWLSFRRNGTGWVETPVRTCPIIEYRVCQLYNASYELTFNFTEGNQTIEGYPPTLLNQVDYPILNLTEPSDLPQLSYSAYMWAFTDQLVGQMGYYNDTAWNASIPAVYNEIQTDIAATSILGSSDLDCFFTTDVDVPASVPGSKNYTGMFSPQRQQDIDLARNQTLDELIPELAFNTTVSLMSDILLA